MLELGRRQNMTGWKLNGLEVNAQLTRWFVSFAELSCPMTLRHLEIALAFFSSFTSIFAHFQFRLLG